MAKFNAQVVHTQYQLATLKKSFEYMSDYFNKTKTLTSFLGAAGRTLLDYEFFVYLLARLGINYESLVTSLTTHPDSISPQ